MAEDEALQKKKKKKVKTPVEAEEGGAAKEKKAKKVKAAEAVVEPTKEKKTKKRKAEPEAPVEEAPAEAEAPKKDKKKKKKKKKAEAAEEEAAVEEEPPKKKKKAKKEKKETEAAASAEEEEASAPVAAAPAPAAAEEEGAVKTCFCNNLAWSVDEDSFKAHFAGCAITNIKWIEDRDTGKFKGMAIVDFASTADAAKACEKNETELLGRTMYCRLDEKRAQQTPREPRKYEMKPKPEGGKKIYCGNLSYDIDDAAIKAFFEDCGHVADVRWVTNRDTGDFKGCGFLEFESSEAADAAIAKNGETLMGRPIRLDWAEDKVRPPKTW